MELSTDSRASVSCFGFAVGTPPRRPLSDQRRATCVLRLSSMTRAPCLKVIAALGQRSQAARKIASARLEILSAG